jgi:hypothetical protein
MFSCTPTSKLWIHFSLFSLLSYCSSSLPLFWYIFQKKIIFFLFNHILYCNREKHFSSLPSQLRLIVIIVISIEFSIDLHHDKSHKLNQFFKIPISWVLITVWYLILEVVFSWKIVLKWWNPRKGLLEFFSFLLVFSDCIMQHLEDDAKINLEDGK